MKPDSQIKRRKTFPLGMDEELHKALKHKAIESDKTLHAYIIDTLKSMVQEDESEYRASNRNDSSTEDHQP